MSEQWEPPICLRLGGEGCVISVSNIFEAAHFLLYSWPARRGKAYDDAWQQCVLALKGAAAPSAARLAVEKAAREAGILEE